MQCLIEPIEEHFPNQVMVVGLNMFYLLVNGSLGWPLFTIYTVPFLKAQTKTKTKIKTKNKDKDKCWSMVYFLSPVAFVSSET